ncbi:hypothetical protein ACZ87_03418 [Candidatus Erwinia dacicola]|uniref:Uncharacterized protein n=1 Tax=Candidatus Erwinia dacicola TaxID=252393 RepID=A0A328TH99_9GAMM|nr:hypothetical protein ACZ87_03418 [Candidatus Erwinia dacicola]
MKRISGYFSFEAGESISESKQFLDKYIFNVNYVITITCKTS